MSELRKEANTGPAPVDPRPGRLLSEADLRLIGKDRFTMLCNLFNSIDTRPLIDAKQGLLQAIDHAISQHDEIRDEMKKRTFVDDRPETRASFLQSSDDEVRRLRELKNVVVKLDAAAAAAFLFAIEAVYDECNLNPAERCDHVYNEIEAHVRR